MTTKHITLIVLITFMIAACESGRQKEAAGTLIGGAGGALLGSQIGSGSGRVAAGVIGGLLGAYVGNYLGRQLDERDRLLANQTAQRSFEYSPDGRQSTWHNPNTGHAGSFEPNRTYNRVDGTACREYTSNIKIGGNQQRAYGTACRQPDGSWRIISENLR